MLPLMEQERRPKMKCQLIGKRVLIVEDERTIAENLAFEITAKGGKVVGPVATVNAALDLIANTGLDGAILDLNLMGEMAFPVADALATSHIPFVIMTGFNARAAVPSRHASVSCLQKPVTPYVICRELEAIFDASNGHGPTLGDNRKVAAVTSPVLHGEALVNVLIVDDDPKNLTVLEAILDSPSYRLVRAESAEQALLALLFDEFALLILDIRMPDMTGLELAKMIRARKRTANVPIIFLSAYYDDDQQIIEGYETGGVDYVAKPVNPAILRSKVGNFAQLYRKQRNLENINRALAAVVDSSDDAILSKDLNGIIATFNRGAERLFGYRAEEVVGKPVTILIPPDRQHEEPEILARIRRGERIDHYETVRHRKDGTPVDISLTVSPVKDDQGRIIGASKIARDITEHKLSEAKLRDSERQLQELIAAIPAAIYTTDAQGKITFFNQAAAELAGRTPTIGSDEWCVTWKLYHPNGTPLPYDECPMAIALREGRAIRNTEVVAERHDGIRVPFIPYPTPLRDGAGKIIGAINMLVDVSERKQAETQQRVLLNELNHRVKNNMQMLQILLEAGAQRAESAEAREVLEEASGRIMAMAAAQRVLYTTPDATRFNARDFLNAVCEAAKRTFPQELEIDYEGDAVQLSNDAAMPLALIANELLTNAVKYGLNGQAVCTTRVRLRRQDDSFLFYVEDDGPGFDLQSVQRRSSGLKLVQGLARQLGGKFEVTRTPATRCSLQFQ
jgi:PAS domain S-box-containing protein